MQTPAFAATKTVGTWKLFRGMIWVAAVMACLCPALAFGQTNSSWNGGTGNWSDWATGTRQRCRITAGLLLTTSRLVLRIQM